VFVPPVPKTVLPTTNNYEMLFVFINQFEPASKRFRGHVTAKITFVQ
jgi:hypothetical protein